MLKNRYDSLDSKKAEEGAELVFFEFQKSENLCIKGLLIGKKYIFFIEGDNWISNRQETIG